MKKLLFMIVCAVTLCACGGSGSKKTAEPQNESREMAASTLKMKGTHASWFKVEEPYLLRLVKTPDNGWQVRVKINFVKVKDIDAKRYQPRIKCCPEMAYIDDCDVEVQEGQLSGDYFNSLCAKEIGEPEELVLQPFSWNEMTYENAKKIYDATVSVLITDMDLDELKKEDVIKKVTDDIFDDDDVKELKDAAETAGKILEAEKNLLDALF